MYLEFLCLFIEVCIKITTISDDTFFIVYSQVYRKPLFTVDMHMELYKKSKKVFNSRQLAALKNLYAWRDKISRLEDESIG